MAWLPSCIDIQVQWLQASMKTWDPRYESPLQSQREQGLFNRTPRKAVRPSLHGQWSGDWGRLLCFTGWHAVSVILCAHFLSLKCVNSKCPRLSTYREEGFSLTHYLGNFSPGWIDFVSGSIARPHTIAGECGRTKLLSTWAGNIKESR